MSSSYEKSVKGGTKVKLAPPKTKYIEHILQATHAGEAGVGEIFRTLTYRLRDSTWTVAYKSLIIVHFMIQEGAADVTLAYLAVAPRNRLAINSFTDVQTQGQNIRTYSDYLLSRALAYERTKCDFVRSGDGRMKKLTVDKGLLRETEIIQNQVKALVKCDPLSNDTENEISLTAFRLLTRDLLDLYNVENEAVMNVLSHYFEMSRPDAERAIKIYKDFCKQTELVVQYLSVARQYEHATRLEIPKLKHAPTSLAASLQDYLDDNDFEINRRQYLAEQDAKKLGGKPATAKPFDLPSKPSTASKAVAPSLSSSAAQATSTTAAPKGVPPELIDFFDSIEQSQQQPAAPNPFLQQQQQPAQLQSAFTGVQAPQQGLPYQQMPQQLPNGYAQPQQLQSQFTGAGFGGYTPQAPPPQQTFVTGNGFSAEPATFGGPAPTQSPLPLQPQSTNPFRQSMLPPANTGNFGGLGGGTAHLPQRQSTNPFARSTPAAIPEESAFSQQQQQQSSSSSSQSPYSASPLQAQATGTNPFAKPVASPPPAGSGSSSHLAVNTLSPIQVQATGSTNPFRQSAFVNQQTGQGWQYSQSATMGGMENLETVPVFPRPGQATGQAAHQTTWL